MVELVDSLEEYFKGEAIINGVVDGSNEDGW